MSDTQPQSPEERRRSLHDRVGALMAKGQLRKALALLDQIIEDEMPLFSGAEWVIEELGYIASKFYANQAS